MLSKNLQLGKKSLAQIDLDMQELVELVFKNYSDDIDFSIKQTFLAVAKTFYYTAHCDAKTIDIHISKVLFESVV